MNATYHEPMPKERRIEVVNRVEALLGDVVINGFKFVCVDCLQSDKPGTARYDGAFLCDECLTQRSMS